MNQTEVIRNQPSKIQTELSNLPIHLLDQSVLSTPSFIGICIFQTLSSMVLLFVLSLAGYIRSVSSFEQCEKRLSRVRGGGGGEGCSRTALEKRRRQS